MPNYRLEISTTNHCFKAKDDQSAKIEAKKIVEYARKNPHRGQDPRYGVNAVLLKEVKHYRVSEPVDKNSDDGMLL